MSDPLWKGQQESSPAAPTSAPSTDDAAAVKSDPVAVYDIEFDATTGGLVGFASLLTNSFAVLHPAASRVVLAREPRSQLKFRLQVPGGPHGLAVYDGTAVVGALDDGPAVAVELDHPALTTTVPNLDTSGNSPVSIQEQIGRYLRNQSADDPPAPRYPAPTQPQDKPGILYWFCKAFPSASCC